MVVEVFVEVTIAFGTAFEVLPVINVHPTANDDPRGCAGNVKV